MRKIISLNPIVAVLISTYNGEKYLNEQLNSLLSQDYDNFIIYIRDDGSVDGTVSILAEYLNYEFIKVIACERGNLGPSKSFITLVGAVEAEIYMFCDQDDVWLSNKISTAVERIVECGLDMPCLFYSNISVVDRDCNLINKSFSQYGGISTNSPQLCLNVLAVQNSVVGCTVAFTNALKNRVFQANIMECYVAMHDWWFALYAVCLGKVIYDSKPLILYRQHDRNVSGVNIHSFFIRFFRFKFKERVSRLRLYKSRIARQAHSFLMAYENELTFEQRSTLMRISKISGDRWIISWANCMIHRVRFDSLHMNIAFLFFPPCRTDRYPYIDHKKIQVLSISNPSMIDDVG